MKNVERRQAGWNRHLLFEDQKTIWTDPSSLIVDGKRYKAWRRIRYKAEKASEWAIVDLPFNVTEPINVKWPNRCGIGTKLESWVEYKPYE